MLCLPLAGRCKSACRTFLLQSIQNSKQNTIPFWLQLNSFNYDILFIRKKSLRMQCGAPILFFSERWMSSIQINANWKFDERNIIQYHRNVNVMKILLSTKILFHRRVITMSCWDLKGLCYIISNPNISHSESNMKIKIGNIKQFSGQERNL